MIDEAATMTPQDLALGIAETFGLSDEKQRWIGEFLEYHMRRAESARTPAADVDLGDHLETTLSGVVEGILAEDCSAIIKASRIVYALNPYYHKAYAAMQPVPSSELAERLRSYYVPQLTHSMESARAFANKHESPTHRGMADAFGTAIGCINEALSLATQPVQMDIGKAILAVKTALREVEKIPKPSIAELEAILIDNTAKVELQADGSVLVIKSISATVKTLVQACAAAWSLTPMPDAKE